MSSLAIRDEVVAKLPTYIHIETDSLSFDDVPWCPSGRVWEIVPDDVASVSANDPVCGNGIQRGAFICEHMIEIGD